MNAAWKKTVLLLAGATLATLLALYALRLLREPAGRKPEAPGALLEAATALGGQARLVRLTLTSGSETTVLEKRPDGRWWVTAPVTTPADAAAVDEVVRALLTLRPKAELERQPTQEVLERQGLRLPRFQVEAVTEEGRKLGLEGGIENPFDGSVSARRPGEGPLFSLEGRVRIALQRSLFDLRDKHVLAVPPDALRSIEVRNRSGNFGLDHTAPKSWRLSGPHPAAADAQAVSQMLAALQNTLATAFPADAPAFRSTHGLEPAELDLRLVRRSGEPLRIRFGRAESKGYVLVDEGQRSELAEVPEDALQPFEKSATQLMDPALLHFSTEEVRELVLQLRPGSSLRLLREGGDGGPDAWEVVEPRLGRARRWKVASLLWVLAHLSPLPSSARAPSGKDLVGLTRVVLKGAGGVELATLELGGEVPGEPEHRFARVGRGPFVAVDASRLRGLPQTPEELLEVSADAGP